jgi:DNA-binding NarL/FixJ family response regulator
MEFSSLNKILVIDEIPLVHLGLQEVFRTVNESARVEHLENIFTVLSSKAYENTVFDLIVIGSLPEKFSENFHYTVAELKIRFGNPRIMLYTTTYEHTIIEKMGHGGVDAYVHKFEPVEEIRKAYLRLQAGELYISGIIHTLYYEYGLKLQKPPED